jgi:Spy/CpxP family protein refolding chaperone
MTTTRKLLTVFAAAGLAAATALAYADPPGRWGGGYGPGMMGYGGPHGGFGPCAAAGAPCGGVGPGAAAGVGPVARMEQRLSFLKNELKIAPEQEPAWNAYAEQAKTQATTMEAFHAQPAAAAQTPAERMEQRAERMNLRAKQITAMSASVKELYAVLTPEQKAVADLHFGGRRLSQASPRGYAR